jgi:PAS domain S-box-containing protein
LEPDAGQNCLENNSQVQNLAFAGDSDSRLLARALQSLKDGICITDEQDQVVFANDAFLLTYGYQPETLYGQSIAAVYSGDQGRTGLSRELAGQEEGRIVHGQGRNVPVTASTSSVVKHGKDAGATVWVFRPRGEYEKEKLLRAEERYTAFVQQTTECIWRVEFDPPVPVSLPEDAQVDLFFQCGYIAECNDVMARKYGLREAAELVGARLDKLLVRSNPAHIDQLHRLIRSGYRLRNEESHEVDGSGVSRFLSNNVVGTVQNGLLVCCWGTQRDISELRRTEEALNFASEILKTVTAFVLVANHEGDITYASPSLRALGYDPKDVLGKGWWELTHSVPEERNQAQRVMADVANGSQPVNPGPYETVVKSRDGSQRWVLWQDSAKISGYVIGVGQDITDRKATQGALAASEGRLRKLVDSNVVGVLFTALDGRITEANDAFLALVGYSREELEKGQLRWDSMTPPEWRFADERAIQELRNCGFCSPIEKEYVRKNGTRVPVLMGAALLPDSVHECACIVVDLTERKKVEREREVLYEELSHAQKLEAVGQLAGGIAHDFNNLLAAISGYAELLLAKLSAEDPRSGDAERILAAVRRAAHLTAQLLAFSRKQTANSDVLDMNAMVSDVLDMLQRLIREDIRLVFSPAPGLQAVDADRNQIEQVIINLVINARDAMPKGGELRIETANVTIRSDHADRTLPPGEYGSLSVTDTGVGMDKPTLARIFEPFFTTKGVGKGTGLGLSTVYGIVKHSGGHVTVESEPGQGTKFVIYLPKAVDVNAPADGQERVVDAKAGHETILLVEDMEELRETSREYLEQLGYTVLLAGDGEEALDVASHYAREIHLLITDLVMPRLHGRSLRKRLLQVRPELKTLFMSGYAEEFHRDRAAGPAVPILQKPFTFRKLSALVREVLDSGKTPSARQDGD